MSFHPCASCREAFEELQEELLQAREHVRGADGEEYEPPWAWDLTPSQRIILKLLCQRRVVPASAFIAAMEARFPDWSAEPKIMQVHMSKMRRKLASHGVFIVTRWGEGYALDPACAEAVRETCRGDPGDAPVREPKPWSEGRRAAGHMRALDKGALQRAVFSAIHAQAPFGVMAGELLKAAHAAGWPHDLGRLDANLYNYRSRGLICRQVQGAGWVLTDAGRAVLEASVTAAAICNLVEERR